MEEAAARMAAVLKAHQDSLPTVGDWQRDPIGCAEKVMGPMFGAYVDAKRWRLERGLE